MLRTRVKDLQDRLVAQGQTLATAESCTGGMIAARLTDRAGSSAYFLGGVVVYSNALKTALLGVPEALLARHGAVSAEVAGAMVRGARRNLGADWAVAVTGVAGPGASEAKPAGLVYLAVAGPHRVLVVERQDFSGGRAAVRRQTVERALELLWDQIVKSKASA